MSSARTFRPYIYGAAVALATLLMWQFAVNVIQQKIDDLTRVEAVAFTEELKRNFASYESSLSRMVSHIQLHGSFDKDLWDIEVQYSSSTDQGWDIAHWIDEDYVIQWVHPVEVKDTYLGRNISTQPAVKTYLDRVKSNDTRSSGVFWDSSDEGVVSLHAPITINDAFRGFIGGFIQVEKFLRLTHAAYPDIDVVISGGGKELFRSTMLPISDATPGYQRTESFVGNTSLQIETTPSAQFLAKNDTHLPASILISGLLLSAFIFQVTRQNNIIRHAARSQERLTKALDQSHDAMFICDNKHRIVELNNAATSMFGYTRAELIGKNVRDLADPSFDFSTADRVWQESVENNEPYRVAIPTRKKNGDVIVIEISRAQFRNDKGDVAGIISMGRNVTDQLKKDAELISTERRFRTLFEANQSGIILWEATEGNQAVITDVNQALVELLGYSVDEIKDRADTTSMAIPEDRARLRRSVEELASAGHTDDLEVTYTRKDGTLVDVIVSMWVIFDDAGKHYQTIAAFKDITEQKRLQEKLRHAERLQVVGQLTGGVAHDFNNILGVISSSAELIDFDNNNEPDLKENTARIHRAVGHGAELTNKLLAFSRKQKLDPSDIPTLAFVTETKTTLKRLLGERIEISVNIDPDIWTLHADEQQLSNAILNLALNGRDAMEGSGHLTLEVKNTHFAASDDPSISKTNPKQYVSIAVTDTGYGMPEHVLGKAFEPFYTTKEVGHGSGLGLSMVHGFAEQSEGRVSIQTEEGVGTTVTLLLPGKDIEAATPKAPQRAETAGASDSFTVLVVEDQPELRSVTDQIIQRLGYKTVVAGDADEAITLASRSDKIDAALVDVVLPGEKNGSDLASTLLQLHPDIKIMFTTGYAAEKAYVDIAKVNHFGLFPKPLRVSELAKKLEELGAQQVPGNGDANRLSEPDKVISLSKVRKA